MPRYIDADNLIDKCDCLYKETNTETVDFMRIGYNHAVSDTIAIARNLPTADVRENVHAHFIGTEYDGYADGYPVFYEWKCSNCGCIFEDEEPTYNFCPICGAHMDERSEDE